MPPDNELAQYAREFADANAAVEDREIKIGALKKQAALLEEELVTLRQARADALDKLRGGSGSAA